MNHCSTTRKYLKTHMSVLSVFSLSKLHFFIVYSVNKSEFSSNLCNDLFLFESVLLTFYMTESSTPFFSVMSLLLFSWPPVDEVCTNYEVVMFLPWAGTPMELGSVANCYVDILL